MKTFHVTLNWHGELHQFTIRATQPWIAAKNAVYGLAKKLGRARSTVSLHLNDGDKVIVKEVRE